MTTEMNPHDWTTTRARDLNPGDAVVYGIHWSANDEEGFRTGTGTVAEVIRGRSGSLVRVEVTVADAKYMELSDRLCLFSPQRLRRIA